MAQTDRYGVAIVAITRHGAVLGARLRDKLDGSDLYVTARFGDLCGRATNLFDSPLSELLRDIFPRYSSLVLFVALGAAVRLVGPLLRDKRTDPGVVVVDDLGKHVISMLSGHLGGANDLARDVAVLLDAEPVVTTASDVLGTLSPDLLGQELGWVIENREKLTLVSAALVNGEPVGLYQDAGESDWWPVDKGPAGDVRVFDKLHSLASSSCRAALIITDRLLGDEYLDLLGRSVVYRPHSLVVGIGCNRGTPLQEIERAISDLLKGESLSDSCIRNLATIDVKSDEPGLQEFASTHNLPVAYFSGSELDAVERVPNPSEYVRRAVGAQGVCEPAAMLGAGAEELLVPKRKIGNVTLAVARVRRAARPGAQHGAPHEQADRPESSFEGGGHGTIFVVGIGPGSKDQMTFRARDALSSCDVVVGYKTYLSLINELVAGKEVISSGMMQEVKRAHKAVELASTGRKVAVVSSGDAGVYGMAGLIYEVARAQEGTSPIDIEVVPGVSALNAAAALLGAPLMHDFAVISLSDLLTPWETIARRLDAAGQGDFVVALYNPKSGRRTQQVEEARRILLKYRSGTTPVGIVTSAYRDGQQVAATDLAHMLEFEIGMLTVILVGNSRSTSFGGVIVTPRGYEGKYELGGPAGSIPEKGSKGPS